jgi:hypothetical protein
MKAAPGWTATSTRQACTGVVLPTNNDNIAQNNEIGPARTPPSVSGRIASRRGHQAAVQRRNDVLGVSPADVTAVSVGEALHRTFGNLSTTDCTNITTSDYSSFILRSAGCLARSDDQLSGRSAATMSRLNPAKTSVFGSSQLDINVPDQSIYNGMDMSVRAASRVPRSSAAGRWKRHLGLLRERRQPNGPAINDLYLGAPSSATAAGSVTRASSTSPTREFKAAGNYPLPMAFEVGAVLQSYAGSPRVITYNPAASLFPGGARELETSWSAPRIALLSEYNSST